jgi:hypothetical protein
MDSTFSFTFKSLRKQFEIALINNYSIIPCIDYVRRKKELKREDRTKAGEKLLINRIDIDISCKKAKRLAEIFNDLNIKGTFFVRLHAHEYNPFSFENYRCLKYIIDNGHEIGYHSEVIDEAAIWNEDKSQCLVRDIKVLENIFNIKISGVASHGGMTGLNNLDFWKDKTASDFGLLYEGYDREKEFDLFHNSLYVSDSSWTYWKCYVNGILKEGDRRNLGEHCNNGHPIIYALIHPDTYYDEHFYE